MWLWHRRQAWNCYWLLRSPSQTCHAKPSSINRRRTLPAFPLVGCLPQAAWPERLLSENQDAVQQIKERRRLPMIDRGDIRQAIDRCGNIWASLPGAGCGQFEHKADSWSKFKEAGGTVRRDWCEQSHRDYLRSGYLHHRLPVMGC